MAVCRAGLVLLVTGALAAGAGTPYAGALVALGVVLLAVGGWITGQSSGTRRKR